MDIRKKRFARRLQVRFWIPGDDQPRSAYTTNVSTTGMFVCTGSPAAPGDRVRIEVLDETNSFMVEGVVVHAARVSPLLRKLRDSGMGVRFLRVDELIGAIVPTADVDEKETRGAEEEAPAADEGETGEETPASAETGAAPSDAEGGSRPSTRLGSAERTEPPSDPSPLPVEPAGDPGPAAAATPDAPPRQVSRGAPSRRPAKAINRTPLRAPRERSYTLRFASLPSFLAIFERDIKVGGVYVTTQSPAKLREQVTIEIRVPEPVSQSLRARARVVHVVEPGEEEANLLAGMGVELEDVEGVVGQLNSLIYD